MPISRESRVLVIVSARLLSFKLAARLFLSCYGCRRLAVAREGSRGRLEPAEAMRFSEPQ
jgi:hypothetical protein